MAQVLLTKSNVPQYLVNSDYFLGLKDGEEFTVPIKFLKPDPNVASCEKLCHILETALYWRPHKLPRDVVQFLVAERDDTVEVERICSVLSQFDAEIPLLQAFKSLYMPIMPIERNYVASLLYCAFVGDGTLNNVLVKAAAENGLDQLLNSISGDVAKIHGGLFARFSMQTVVSRGHIGSLRFLLKLRCHKEYGIYAFAAEVGRLDCMKLLHEFGYQLEERVINAAAFHGHLSCVEFAHTLGCRVTEHTAMNAAAGGNVDCVKYVLSHGAPATGDVLTAAARSGHAHVLLLLQKIHCPVGFHTVAAAASNGHLDCIHQLIAQGVVLREDAIHAASTGDHIKCLELLHVHGCPRSPTSVTAAASSGSLNCLEFLLRTGCSVDSTAAITAATTNGHANCLAALMERVGQAELKRRVSCVDIAARTNKMDCLQLLFDAGVPLDLTALHEGFSRPNYKDYLRRLLKVGYYFPSSAARYAIAHQNFECLQYLCEENKVSLSSDLCTFAALQSNLQYIKLLCQYNCPWSVDACACAAACNNLPSLTYLHEEGCPWDETIYSSMISGWLNPPRQCIIYALENGCPLGGSSNVHLIASFMLRVGVPLTVVITNAAVESGSIECLQHVLSRGAPMDASTTAAAARYDPVVPSLMMLEYLHSQGCPWDERTSNAAAAHPTATCLRYVCDKGCPWSSASVALAAAFNGAAECLTFAIEYGWDAWVYDEAVVLAAAAQPSSECLTLLHNTNCCHWGVSVALAAASAGSLACLEYAHEKDCPWDANVCEAAVQHLDCLHYCIKEDCPAFPFRRNDYFNKFPDRRA